MKTNFKRMFFGALLLSLLAAFSPNAIAGDSERELIADLSSSSEGKVERALHRLEKDYPHSTNALPQIRKLLADPREDVRRKAARVLGVLHAEVTEADLANIAAMLKSREPREVIDALKALRGLEAQSTVPEILPLLRDSTVNVVRDSCRTLAVIGNKDCIPKIEPLLNHPDDKVRTDAREAIYRLKSKS